MSELPSLLRSLSLRYWRRYPTRILLVLGCLALGVATWTATRSLEQGVRQSGRDAAAPLGGAADFCISNEDAGVPIAWAEQFRRLPGVVDSSAILIRRIRLSAPESPPVLALGIDLAKAQSRTQRIQLSANTASNVLTNRLQGRVPVLLGYRLAQEIGDAHNSLEFQLADKSVRVFPAGTIDTADGPERILTGRIVVFDRADLARLVGDPDRVSRIDVKLGPGANPTRARDQLSKIVAGAAQIRTGQAFEQRSGDMFAGLTTAFALCGIGGIIAGLLLTFNVLSVSAAERRRDWGILRSQGATRGQITALLFAEAMALGLIGGAIGLPLAYALVQLSAGPIQRVLSELVLPLTEIRVDLSCSMWLNGLFVGMIAAVVAAIIPAVQTARLDPIAALRRIDESPHRPVLWRSLIPSVAIAFAGGAILECAPHWSSGTWASLFCLVVAILFLTPQLTRLFGFLLRPAVRRWAGVAFTLALDNLLRWPRRYGMAAATLAGGTALLMQTGGVIRSNEDAVRDWLDRSVIGDLFVTSGGPLSASGQNLPMRDSLADAWRQRIPGLRVVPMRFRYVDWRQDDHSARILLVLLDAPAYRSMIEERFPDLPDRHLYQLLSEQPDAALVSRNFAALHNLKAGDRLGLPSVEGPKTFRILGSVADYSCMQGTVLIDRSRHARAFDGSLADVWSVAVPAGMDIDRARQDLQESSGAASESLFVVTHEEMRSHALGMIRRLYGVAVAQQSLVAFASILGVAAAMAISVLKRSGELGTLRGLGATRFQMIRFVLAESFMVGLLGTVAGLLLGIPLEWFMVKVVLLSETGFVFPMRIPWGVALIGSLLTPACAALGGLAPALTAARINSAGAVACE